MTTAVPSPRLPWTEGYWQADAHAWIGERLARQGIRITGPIEQPHVRPWSTVLQVPTAGGTVYFKATAPALRHEAALHAALARWQPALVPAPLAIDAARGWLLLPDFGETVRERVRSAAELAPWHTLLPRYARMQQALAARATRMLALGALERRPALLPALLDTLLADRRMLLVGEDGGLSEAQLAQLHALKPRVAALCDELVSSGIPPTVHHEDLHDANIFVRGERYLLSDWGEAGVGHPFCSLLVTLRSLAYRFDLEADDPALRELRDRYLSCWSAYGDPAALQRTFVVAQLLGMLCRALTWHRVLAPLDRATRGDDASAVAGWLETFLGGVGRLDEGAETADES